MTMVEEIYRRARRLPEDKAAEVLDFIAYLETTLHRRPAIPRKSPSLSEWLKPIHIDSWDDNIDLSREAMYGDDGR
ncbi:MAG: DUF2281 protein [Magnetococcales bacterium]|nr:DUF2281 protein [Magnetococcales bacterium]HIJ82725.1 DUF2281 domain-containing protein [Magnetococcales bacterium]